MSWAGIFINNSFSNLHVIFTPMGIGERWVLHFSRQERDSFIKKSLKKFCFHVHLMTQIR